MRSIIFIPLLAIFAVPSGIVSLSRDLVSSFNPSPSVSMTAARDVSNEPSRVPTTTPTSEKPAPSPSRAAAAAAAAEPKPAPAVPPSTPVPVPTAPSAPAPAPAPTASVSNDFASQVEAEVLLLTNAERAKEGLSTLSPDKKLRDVAWGHSADMLANDYFRHDDQSGCSSSCRATDTGYRWRAIGENIYMMSGYKITPEKAAAMVVDGWMNSSGHRTNILGDSFTESGVGVVSDGKSVYVTALYAKPR